MKTRFCTGMRDQGLVGNPFGFGLVVVLCLALGACVHWREAYFDEGVGALTQSDVRTKFGKPHIANTPLLSDETTWVYRYALTESELDPSGVKTFGKQAGNVLGGAPGSAREKVYCFRYTLIFDQEHVLRKWKREPCRIPEPPNPFTQGLSG